IRAYHEGDRKEFDWKESAGHEHEKGHYRNAHESNAGDHFADTVGPDRGRPLLEHRSHQARRLFVTESLHPQIADDVRGRVAPGNLRPGLMFSLGPVNLSGEPDASSRRRRPG